MTITDDYRPKECYIKVPVMGATNLGLMNDMASCLLGQATLGSLSFKSASESNFLKINIEAAIVAALGALAELRLKIRRLREARATRIEAGEEVTVLDQQLESALSEYDYETEQYNNLKREYTSLSGFLVAGIGVDGSLSLGLEGAAEGISVNFDPIKALDSFVNAANELFKPAGLVDQEAAIVCKIIECAGKQVNGHTTGCPHIVLDAIHEQGEGHKLVPLQSKFCVPSENAFGAVNNIVESLFKRKGKDEDSDSEDGDGN